MPYSPGVAPAEVEGDEDGGVGDVDSDSRQSLNNGRGDGGGSDAVGKGIGRRRRRQEIAGHLLADEDVVGLVVVERLDDVVAILPGKRCRIVARLAGRVGIADDIKPVPAPSLTVGGRCQQPFDQ